MPISESTAQTHLDTWLTAEANLALGQSVEVDGIKYTQADLEKVLKAIDYWSRKVALAQRGGSVSAQRIILND